MELALTFDDVLLVPSFSDILPRDVNLTAQFSRNITLNLPLVTAAMDSVTESKTAICIAQLGGIGVVHRNLSPDIQATQVSIVKKFESGVITDPICVAETVTVREVIDLTQKMKISGVPVLDASGRLTGIVTSRDLRFETRFGQPITAVMTPKDKLITAPEGASKGEIKHLLHEHRIEKVLLVDDDFELKGLVTVKDLQKQTEFPAASKDGKGRLRVAAAVGTGADTQERVDKLIDADVDAIVVDTAHGHSRGVLDRIALIKREYPQIDVVGGNIATADAALAMAGVGADGVKVGIGPGSICTTRIVAGVGLPQITAISDVVRGLETSGIPLIADGGIRYSGDIAKAIAAGAHCTMIGSLFAGAPIKVTVEWGLWVLWNRARKIDIFRKVNLMLPSSCRKGLKAAYRTKDRWHQSFINWPVVFGPAWDIPAALTSIKCVPVVVLFVLPILVCERAMCMMSLWSKKRQITVVIPEALGVDHTY